MANPRHWDVSRGPHLAEVVFRNDLSPEQALDLVCTTEGEVDIVTEVPPAEAARVEASKHAKLVSIDAIRAIIGVIDRDTDGLPFGDLRVRQALNRAVDLHGLIADAMHGHARPLARLTPRSGALGLELITPPLFSPYPHDPERSAELWREAGGEGSRPIRIAAWGKPEAVARRVAADIHEALGIGTEMTVLHGREEMLEARRRLATRESPRAWDILVLEQGAQAADTVATKLHRAFAGASGEYRDGPIVPAFEEAYADLVAETARLKQSMISHRIDKLVHDEALALFLCAPDALYAVNRHVDFTPYRSTFELAETKVTSEHWSCTSR